MLLMRQEHPAKPGLWLYDSTTEPDERDEFTAQLGGDLFGAARLMALVGSLMDLIWAFLVVPWRCGRLWKTPDQLLPRASRGVACEVVLCLVTYSVFLSTATAGWEGLGKDHMMPQEVSQGSPPTPISLFLIQYN